MKRFIKLFAVSAAIVAALASCQKEILSDESVIKETRAEKTDFDKWLDANFLLPYNIDFKYRYELMESNVA